MMRHSQNVRTKGKRSFREKQVSQTCQSEGAAVSDSSYVCLIEYEGETVFTFQLKIFCVSSPARSTGCTPEKEEAAQVGHLDIVLCLPHAVTNLNSDCV